MPKVQIYRAAFALHKKFYNAVFQDSRLEKLPIVPGEIQVHFNQLVSETPEINPSERFLNVPLLETAYQLTQASKTTTPADTLNLEERTKNLWDAMETLLDPYPSDQSGNFRFSKKSQVFKHKTEQGIRGVNHWLREKNALLLINDFDPIELFKKSRAYETWVIHQKLERNRLSNITATLRGLGIADKDINRAISNAESYLNSAILDFTNNLCDTIVTFRQGCVTGFI